MYTSVGEAEAILAELEDAKTAQDVELQTWWQGSALRVYLENKAAEYDTVERAPLYVYYDIDNCVTVEINVLKHRLVGFRLTNPENGRALNSRDEFLAVDGNNMNLARGTFDPDSKLIRDIESVLLEAKHGGLSEIFEKIASLKRAHPELYEAVMARL